MTESEISYKIRGAIYAVYNTLGPGLLESVYQEALVYQLRKDGLEVKEQVVKTEDIHPPKTGISVHFCVLSLMAMQK